MSFSWNALGDAFIESFSDVISECGDDATIALYLLNDVPEKVSATSKVSAKDLLLLNADGCCKLAFRWQNTQLPKSWQYTVACLIVLLICHSLMKMYALRVS